MEDIKELYVKKYAIRNKEDMGQLIKDYFLLSEEDNFYDLGYKDFKKIFLNNLGFLFQRNFLITLDDFCYMVQKYFED